MEKENKQVGHVSTMMTLTTSKEGYLLPYFDKVDETENGKKATTLKETLINNHEDAASRRVVKGHLPLEYIFGFCRTI